MLHYSNLQSMHLYLLPFLFSASPFSAKLLRVLINVGCVFSDLALKIFFPCYSANLFAVCINSISNSYKVSK